MIGVGTRVVFTNFNAPSLRGAKGIVKRIVRPTVDNPYYIVKLMEDRKPYENGDLIGVDHYEIRECTE